MNLTAINEYAAQKWTSAMSYLASFFSAAAGVAALNSLAVVLGMVLAYLTYLTNKKVQERKEARDAKLAEQQERINELREKRERMELERLEMEGRNG